MLRRGVIKCGGCYFEHIPLDIFVEVTQVDAPFHKHSYVRSVAAFVDLIFLGVFVVVFVISLVFVNKIFVSFRLDGFVHKFCLVVQTDLHNEIGAIR